MPELIVTVNKLNKRRAIPATLSDKEGIIGVVLKGFRFYADEVPANSTDNKWYKDRDGYFYWGGGVSEIGDKKISVVLPLPDTQTGVTIRVDNPLFRVLGIDKIWNDGEYGQFATVAILDSGISLNTPDLTDAVAEGVPGNFPAASGRMKNFIAGSTTMEDNKGHGSHCAGLIASRNMQHSIGIAKKCKLYVGKISDESNNPSVVNMINGLRWAGGLEEGSPQDIDIISLSSGSLLNIPDMQPTIDEIVSKGKILISSIGNRYAGSLPQGGTYPALCKGTISVGAVDFDNNFQSYSYQSDNLTIACPGTDIISYWKNGETHIETGTSQSTAICAGIIALLVSKLKKSGETNVAGKVKKVLATSPIKTSNGYSYRCINAFLLYQSC